MGHVIIINRTDHFYSLTSFRVILAEIGELLSAYLPHCSHDMQFKIMVMPQASEHGQDCAEHVFMPQRTGGQQT
jgi:hypothetical protein